MALHGISLLVHNELGEVPLDEIEKESALLLLHELPHRVRLLPIHVHLLEQIELDFSVADRALDLLVRAGLLIGELVAGECQNAESCVTEYICVSNMCHEKIFSDTNLWSRPTLRRARLTLCSAAQCIRTLRPRSPRSGRGRGTSPCLPVLL